MQSQRNSLEIYIDRLAGDGVYPVTVRVLETNQSARSSMVLTLSSVELADAQRWLAEGDADMPAVQDFGARLFDALFVGPVRLLYDQLVGDPDRSPAFWLLVGDPGLAQIPWELLYDSRRQSFLALVAPFVRGLAIENPARSQPVDAGPLRVLVASAFPAGLENLEANDEAQRIASALRQTPDGVQIIELAHATLSRLQNALREAELGNTPYHVLHLIAHGYADSATGASAVILEDEHGEADVVQPATFAALLSGLGIQLVFLNACSSASMPASNLAPGFAQALLGVGIPILVGMQAPVSASDAMLFTAELYGSLADGRSVDGALLDVRRVAQQRSADGRTAPAIPVCYTRNMPARLVDAPASKPAAPAPVPVQPAAPSTPTTTGKRGLRRLWGLAAATVALVVGIISGYVSMRDFFCVPPVRGGLPTILGGVCDAIAPQEEPVVVVAPTATPQPRLTGDFKIAVAEFAPVDGASDAGAKGSELAQQLYDQLRDDLDAMASAASVPFSIDMGLAPQEVGRIEGNSYQAQVDNAVRRAREINADLLIFGNLDVSPDKTVLDAYFYQAPTQLHTAEEMAGAYPLAHVESPGNVLDNMVTSSELRSKLLASADGMGRFLFGLGFFNRQQFNEAARWLAEAEQSIPHESRNQRAVVELFLGSTAAQLGDLPLAHQSYQTALELDPRFARALLGRGQIDFLLERIASGCAPGATDVAVIQQALEAYQKALGLTADPQAAIPTKVNFYAGTAYLCLAFAGAGDENWELAQEHLEAVVADYEATGNDRLQYLAAQAQARLGARALSLALKDAGAIDEVMLAAAEDAFDQAVMLGRMPGETALNELWLALIQVFQGRCQAAQTHLQAAEEAFAQRTALDSASAAYADFAAQYRRLRDERIQPLLANKCASLRGPGDLVAFGGEDLRRLSMAQRWIIMAGNPATTDLGARIVRSGNRP